MKKEVLVRIAPGPLLAAVGALLLGLCAPAYGQPSPLPPPPAMDSSAPPKPSKAQRPRTVIRAPDSAQPAADRPAATKPASDRPASDQPASDQPPAGKSSTGDRTAGQRSAPDKPEPLAEPAPGEELPAARRTEREAKIEQIPRGAGVTEIVVTPAFSTHSYTIINREGARRAPQENQSSLSTPRFLRFDF